MTNHPKPCRLWTIKSVQGREQAPCITSGFLPHTRNPEVSILFTPALITNLMSTALKNSFRYLATLIDTNHQQQTTFLFASITQTIVTQKKVFWKSFWDSIFFNTNKKIFFLKYRTKNKQTKKPRWFSNSSILLISLKLVFKVVIKTLTKQFHTLVSLKTLPSESVSIKLKKKKKKKKSIEKIFHKDWNK